MSYHGAASISSISLSAILVYAELFASQALDTAFIAAATMVNARSITGMALRPNRMPVVFNDRQKNEGWIVEEPARKMRNKSCSLAGFALHCQPIKSRQRAEFLLSGTRSRASVRLGESVSRIDR